ncbi:hypothetical protein FE257_007718 [Aspergillus nanangensis]|uniref:Geranylgeranyl pyrophosphate synthase n=1 Tax=Aspergillus nanangensis TaxID=2582783 RepID=A0AAD4CXD9_ASPNN|nr:hypothetical protein FE257_007718 [Aspergillus nanangensis]
MSTHAIPIPEDVVKASGRRLCKFPAMISRHHHLCLGASANLKEEFRSLTQANININTVATVPRLGLVHAVAITTPECLPERLPILTRFADFTVLNDDYYDIAGSENITKYNESLLELLDPSHDSQNGNTRNTPELLRIKQFQADLLLEMYEVDRESTAEVMDMYSRLLGDLTCPPTDIWTLEEYLPFREKNAGIRLYEEVACFGIGIHLTKQEKQRLSPIVDPMCHCASLLNDYYSWPKELKFHLENEGSPKPFNAVYILMKQYHCSESEALQRLQQAFVDHQDIHFRLLHKLERDEGPLPETHQKYITAAQHAASGPEFWYLYCSRYPSKQDLGQPECVLDGDVLKYVTAVNEPLGREPVHNVPELHSATGLDNLPTAKEEIGHQGHISYDKDHDDIPPEYKFQHQGKPGKPPHTSHSSDVVTRGVGTSSDETVLAPYQYISSLPSKKIRNTFIEALSFWMEIPPSALASINTIIGMLHHLSLMLDDIEDNSELRRGQPATHVLFGEAQTINSAKYVFVNAFAELQHLQSPAAPNIFIGKSKTQEVQNLHRGQALDLHWKYHRHYPTVEEYLMMVDNKTGALFRLCVRLVQAESNTSSNSQEINSDQFITQLGRFFQIRDDYKNLTSEEYTNQKGFCEDLDEGKISLPLIYCMRKADTGQQEALKSILQRRANGPLPIEVKRFILKQMKDTGALESTLSLLRAIHTDLIRELHSLEKQFESRNQMLELMARKLWV